jgi:hypothetical protein
MQWIIWLRENSLWISIICFFVMLISAILMYPAAQQGNDAIVWTLVALFALANLAILGTKP